MVDRGAPARTPAWCVRWRPRGSYYWHRPAKISRSRAGCATLTGFPGGRVIGVHHSTESKLGSYFAEGLEQAGLGRAASILSAEADDDAGLLKVTVGLSSVADWKLRSQVHQVAMRVEDEHDVTVLGYSGRWTRFRSLRSTRALRSTRVDLPDTGRHPSAEQIGPSTHLTPNRRDLPAAGSRGHQACPSLGGCVDGQPIRQRDGGLDPGRRNTHGRARPGLLIPIGA